MVTRRPYLIVSHDYTRLSAGVRALHTLARELTDHYAPAYVTGKPGPMSGDLVADDRIVQELVRDGIVVYPEVEDGNPLGARRIVRYILNVPGRIRKAQFTPHELRFAYCGLLSEYIGYDPNRILTIPVIETELFNPITDLLDRKRVPSWRFRKECGYWIGTKCADAPVQMRTETLGMTEITPQWPKTRAALAKLFGKFRWFFSYTEYTAMLTEARLCGCPVVVFPTGLWEREEYEAGVPYGMNGLAWGTDTEEMIRARETVGDFWDDYDMSDIAYQCQLENFVYITQGAFK